MRVVCLIIISFLSNAIADEWVHLKKAEVELRNHNHKTAIEIVDPLLNQLKFTTVEEISQAHAILGVSRCALGDIGHAKEHFETLLIFAPNTSIRKLEPSDSCMKLFSSVAKRDEPVKKKTPRVALNQVPINEQSAEKVVAQTPDTKQPELALKNNYSSWKLWMPYGVGQFANDQPRKGTFCLVSEATLTASALTTFILFQREDKIGDRYVHGDRAKAYQLTFWSSLGTGVILYIWGVIDAKQNYFGKNNGMSVEHLTSLRVNF